MNRKNRKIGTNKKLAYLIISATSLLSLTGKGIDDSDNAFARSYSYKTIENAFSLDTKTKTLGKTLDISGLLGVQDIFPGSGPEDYSLMLRPEYIKELKLASSLNSIDSIALKLKNNYDKDSVMNSIHEMLDDFKDYSRVVNKDFVRGMMSAESSFNPYALSEAGARGLLQALKPTWEGFSNKPYEIYAYDIKENINVGLKYMRYLEDFCSDNYPDWNSITIEEKRDYISAAYNAGQGALQGSNWRIDKISKKSNETENHVLKVDTAMYHNKNYIPTFQRKSPVNTSSVPIAQAKSDTIKGAYQ